MGEGGGEDGGFGGGEGGGSFVLVGMVVAVTWPEEEGGSDEMG